MKQRADFPAMRIPAIGGGRPVVHITLSTDLELSTLVQGKVGIKYEDMASKPEYLKIIKAKVFDQKSSSIDKQPSANNVKLANTKRYLVVIS